MPSTEVNSSSKQIIPVVAGIIYHSNKPSILVSKRTAKQHLAGLWEFPGGKIEPGEASFHALQRELKEELDINVGAAIPLKQITHHYEDKIVELQFWKVTQFTGRERSCEQQEIQWVAIDDLHQLKFPDVNKTIIDSLKLPIHWMITADCNESEQAFIDNIKKSLQRYKIKQLLFRSKQLSDEVYFQIANKLQQICMSEGCFLILNRTTIDASFSNVGWHLTAQQLHTFKRKEYCKELFVSASCHQQTDLELAESQQLNCVLLSPVKLTKSYNESDLLGWVKFKHMVNQTRLPVYALGGLNKADLTIAQYHGAQGIAGISLFKS